MTAAPTPGVAALEAQLKQTHEACVAHCADKEALAKKIATALAESARANMAWEAAAARREERSVLLTYLEASVATERVGEDLQAQFEVAKQLCAGDDDMVAQLDAALVDTHRAAEFSVSIDALRALLNECAVKIRYTTPKLVPPVKNLPFCKMCVGHHRCNAFCAARKN